jgi:hypothetical protein
VIHSIYLAEIDKEDLSTGELKTRVSRVKNTLKVKTPYRDYRFP